MVFAPPLQIAYSPRIFDVEFGCAVDCCPFLLSPNRPAPFAVTVGFWLTQTVASCMLVATAGCGHPGPVAKIPVTIAQVPTEPGTAAQPLPWLPAPSARQVQTGQLPVLINSLDIRKLPVSTVLLALSQQEGLSHDIDECGAVAVTLNHSEIELTELLDRIAELARVRWQLDGRRVSVRCDQPFARSYRIDYPAVERSGLQSGSTALPATGGLIGGGAAPLGAGGQTGSGSQQTATRHQNRFWDTLVTTVEQWLAASEDLIEPTRITETELNRAEQGHVNASSERRPRGNGRDAGAVGPSGPVGSPAVSAIESNVVRTVTTRTDQRRAQVSAHPESGTLHVRATARQHRQLAQWLAVSRLRSRRQVEIQAALLEVRLSSQFERGIQWNARQLAFGAPISVGGATPGLIFSQSFRGEDSAGIALRFLEQFGTVHVISSPRIATLHQQAALLRMVENRVYFTVSAQAVPAGPNSAAFSTFNTQAHTVPVGFMMSILPSIDDTLAVTLTLRPSLSRIIGFVSDPNPGLVSAGINSRVPEIQIREMESVLKLQNGQVALLGGFVQSEARSTNSGIPGAYQAGTWPRWLGSSESEEGLHSELVVLIRARVTGGGAT